MSGNPEFQLRRQAEAAKALIGGLRSMGHEDDAELIADSIEGETSLLEALDEALAEMDETTVLIVGMKDRERMFAERRHAAEARVERLRALIEQAMAICELETIRRPAATLSMRKTPPAVVVENEAEIPSEFFRPVPAPPPKLDKKALAAALAERSIPGASLSNGSVSLAIRRA